MAVDERRWLQLADAARRVLGDEAGTTLMELLPRVGWADVATEHELVLRLDAIEERMDRLDARLDAIGRELRVRPGGARR
jgi:hypothetical protein